MELIVLFILILVNAFFAATEMAFVSLNDAKIEKMAKEGNKKAKSIEKMLKNPSKFLATIQIGITLAGFLSSALASDTFASKIAFYLYQMTECLTYETWTVISMVIVTIILSYFSLVFGELVPKRIAMKNYEKISFAAVGVIKTIAVLTAPFVRFLTFSTNIISKIFGVSAIDEQSITEEEIRMMVDVGEEKGNIESQEKKMINNIFEFNDRIASEIMVHRTNIVAVNIDMTIAEVVEKMSEDTRYSRIPVYDENIDDIKGIIYLKDLLLTNKNWNTKIKTLVKDAYFIPESKYVDELFEEMRKNKKQIAIVIDEHGGTAGLITMEDILEEIVGDIYDEYDKIEKKYEKIDDLTYIFDGEMPIYEVEKILDIKLPEGDYDTLSGYLLENLERIPDEKEKPIFKTEKAIYKVEKCKENKILKVKIKKK